MERHLYLVGRETADPEESVRTGGQTTSVTLVDHETMVLELNGTKTILSTIEAGLLASIIQRKLKQAESMQRHPSNQPPAN